MKVKRDLGYSKDYVRANLQCLSDKSISLAGKLEIRHTTNADCF